LHPELSETDPENYPLIYQYDILANIAPFSKEFSITRDRLYALRSQGGTSEGTNLFMDRIDKMARERYNINDFSRVHDNAIQLPGSGLTRAAYGFAQKTLRKGVAPAEYMVPMGFRPFQKLMGDRGPIEQYEFDRLYGTPFAFWDQPVRDWFRPALYSAANMMGFTGKPAWRQDSDDNAAYFDRLNFEKWVRLSQQAKAQGDTKLAGKYEYMASTTRMGVNPQGNPLAMYWTLPEQDRAFFNQFAQAQGGDRSRILEMVPEDQTHLYQAVWKRMDDGDPSLFPGARGGLDQKYINEQFYGMDRGGPMPPEDWIGWHCLPIGQSVLTTLTSRCNVDIILPGGTVWQTDVSNRVMETFTREVDEMITEVTVERDRVDSMRATGNHKVLAWVSPWKVDHLRRKIRSDTEEHKFIPEWIRIGDLNVGDYLAVPCPGIPKEPEVVLDLAQTLSHIPKLKFDDCYVWNYFKDSNHAATLSRDLYLTPGVAWAVGYYLAEGHVGKRNGYSRYAEWTSHVDEYYLRDRLTQVLTNDFDADYTCSKRIRPSGSSASVRANGVIGEIFTYFAPGVHDTKALHHAEELLTSQQHIEAFLAGVYAGDGTKEASASTLATTSKVLHEQVKEMLITCGISPSVSLLERDNRKPCYLVRFTRNTESAKRIHDQVVQPHIEVKDISPAKPKAFVKNGYLYSRIGQVTPVYYKGPVYDMCIQNVHAYRSPIGLYHNSDVDIGDIRVRYVNEMGKDLHDYGLWESQLRGAMSQPYLEGSTQYLHKSGGIGRASIASNMSSMFHNGLVGSSVSVNTGRFSTNSVQLEYNDNRDYDIANKFTEMMNGY
ncbi:hypothetical protein KA005_15300, partial [bacterium]|nr:hypothetical protein [bacterium]